LQDHLKSRVKVKTNDPNHRETKKQTLI